MIFMKTVTHLSQNSLQPLRLIWFNRVDLFLKLVQQFIHLFSCLCVRTATASPLAVVVKRVKRGEVRVLALFAVNARHKSAKLSWILTSVTNTVKTPGMPN